MTTKRSTFITVFSWLSIILWGFVSLVSLFQNILFITTFSKRNLNSSTSPLSHDPVSVFFQQNMAFGLALMLVFCFFCFVTSIYLLKRKNWARLATIILLLLGILNMIYSIYSMFFGNSLLNMKTVGGTAFADTVVAMKYSLSILYVGITAFFVFSVRKFLLKKTASEFCNNKEEILEENEI